MSALSEQHIEWFLREDKKEFNMEDNQNDKIVKSIVLLRLYNGDMIMGERVINSLIENSNASYVLDNPRAIAVMPSMAGGVKIAMGSVCEPFRVERLKKHVIIRGEQVMFELSEDEIDKELINGYKSEVSGIKIATAADTAAIASPTASTPGEFIL